MPRLLSLPIFSSQQLPLRSTTSMNSTSNQPSQAPEDLPQDDPTAELKEGDIEAAIESVESTPKTLPLKRQASPLFVPAVLPAETPEGEAAAVAAPEGAPTAAAEPGESPPTTSEVTETPAPEPEPELPAVEFLPPPDAQYHTSLTLELRCNQPGVPVHYALNAEDVTDADPVYDPAQKLFLTQPTTVAARVFMDGKPGPLALGRFEVARPAWQKLEPVDQSDPTTHEAADEATLEGAWRLAAASLRGRLHAHRAGWREDAFRHGTAHAGDGTYSIIIVSDGAGSAALSRVASNLACQTALDHLSEALAQFPPLAKDSGELVSRDLPTLRGHLVEAARLALERVREEAATRARPLSEFSATLLILVRREWNGQQLCAALQAGDGGIALWNEDGTLTILGEADHGQQSGETKFLTSGGMEAEFPARVKFSIRPNLRAVAVMSDGVADDFFPEPERFPELFKTVLPLVEGADSSPGAALLDWIDYEKKGSSDDRTLVLSWRMSGSEEDVNGDL